MPTKIRVLFVGDIVGRWARHAIKAHIDSLKSEFNVDFTIMNVENAAEGFGITKKVYDELEPYAEAFTLGNHTWDKADLIKHINETTKLIRPVNFSQNAPGVGWRIFKLNGIEITVINAIGRIFMVPVDNPFCVVDELLELKEVKNTEIKIIDFHAEATSEKQAFGWHMDGKVSAVIGTHTHVQTADERILPGGCAYITDVGMTGCQDGVLGFEKKEAIERLVNYIPHRLKVCKSNIQINACLIEIDSSTGKALSIQRISRTVEP